MTVAFMPPEEERERRIAKLQQMSDQELIEHGQGIKRIIGKPNRNVPPSEGFVRQLQEAREEWRRRHRKT